ncbi:MAG: prepilin peptidase [Nocardioidaceae bacterium]|nr:MAG: prepilin peptidase [Nocardioidaceae bacterium]
MSWYLDAGLVGAAVGAVGGLLAPHAMRALPEPVEDPATAAAFEETEPKEPYAQIAGLPWLRPVAGLAAALAGFLVGARLDFSWELLAVLPFVPAAVALFVIDARTRYLPTWLIGPFYGLTIAVGVIAAIQRADWEPIWSMALGWVIFGGFFTLIWLLVPAGGLGFGDVRLSGLLGLLLGLISWGSVLVGMFAGIMIAGLVAMVLLVTRNRKRYPYGPYLLIGALIGVLWGEQFARWYWPQ